MVSPDTSHPVLEQNQTYSDLADRIVFSGWRTIGSNRGRLRTQPFGSKKTPQQGDCIFLGIFGVMAASGFEVNGKSPFFCLRKKEFSKEF